MVDWLYWGRFIMRGQQLGNYVVYYPQRQYQTNSGPTRLLDALNSGETVLYDQIKDVLKAEDNQSLYGYDEKSKNDFHDLLALACDQQPLYYITDAGFMHDTVANCGHIGASTALKPLLGAIEKATKAASCSNDDVMLGQIGNGVAAALDGFKIHFERNRFDTAQDFLDGLVTIALDFPQPHLRAKVLADPDLIGERPGGQNEKIHTDFVPKTLAEQSGGLTQDLIDGAAEGSAIVLSNPDIYDTVDYMARLKDAVTPAEFGQLLSPDFMENMQLQTAIMFLPALTGDVRYAAAVKKLNDLFTNMSRIYQLEGLALAAYAYGRREAPPTEAEIAVFNACADVVEANPGVDLYQNFPPNYCKRAPLQNIAYPKGDTTLVRSMAAGKMQALVSTLLSRDMPGAVAAYVEEDENKWSSWGFSVPEEPRVSRPSVVRTTWNGLRVIMGGSAPE